MATASKWTQTCLHHCANACAIIKGDNDPDGQGPADDSNGGGGGSATLNKEHPPLEPGARRGALAGSDGLIKCILHAKMVFSVDHT